MHNLIPRIVHILVIYVALIVTSSARAQINYGQDQILKLPKQIQYLWRAETELLDRSADPDVFGSLDTNKQDPFYTPEKQNVFEVKGYWIPESELRLYRSYVPESFSRFFRKSPTGETEFLFLVHPESVGLYRPLRLSKRQSESFLAIATASSRSLILWKPEQPHDAFMAKVSLNKKVSQVLRTLKGEEVAAVTGINEIIAHDSSLLPQNAVFIPETIGAIPVGLRRGGLIMRPLEVLTQNRNGYYIPLFSLYATPKNKGQVTILESLIAADGSNPSEYIRKNIIEPFAKVWFELAVDHGIVMSPHAQNALIEIDKVSGKLTGRFLFRDYSDFNIDFEFRRRAGLFVPEKLPTFSKRVDWDYLTYEHTHKIRDSIEAYFQGGVLFNIQKLIDRTFPQDRNSSLNEILLSEINKVLAQRSGNTLSISSDLENINSVILEAREKYRNRSLARRAYGSCRQLLN